VSIAPFLTELEQLGTGFLTQPRNIQGVLGARAPLPGSTPGMTAADFGKKLDIADATWIRQPALDELLRTLLEAVEAGKRNPVYLVTDASRREVYRRVLLAFAITLKRSGNLTASEEAMAEWIRTFPDQVITRSHDGPDAEQFYLDTRRVLSRRGRGTLTVNVPDLGLQRYVNEVIRRQGVAIPDLLPGLYRVLVVDRYNNARRYAIEVVAGQDPVLHVDGPADFALRITPAYAAFRARDDLGACAGRPGGQPVRGRHDGAPGVVLVKIARADRGVEVAAALHAANRASAIRSASVVLTGNPRLDAEHLIALARFVGLREPSPDLLVIIPAEDAFAARTTTVTSPREAAEPYAAASGSPQASIAKAAGSRRSFLVPGLLMGGGVALRQHRDQRIATLAQFSVGRRHEATELCALARRGAEDPVISDQLSSRRRNDPAQLPQHGCWLEH